jgi:sensor histidine kinase YesM
VLFRGDQSVRHSLILQPLVENAVHPGIEPIAEGGEILVLITHKANELLIKISALNNSIIWAIKWRLKI